MNDDSSSETKSVTVERKFTHAPEKVWRALTQPHLIEEWLMKNDFSLAEGHDFELQANWGTVRCRVLEIEQNRTLSYTWEGLGLESVVTWTLTPTENGTHVRMEQTGFRSDQPQAYGGAKAGWPQFFTSLERVLERID